MTPRSRQGVNANKVRVFPRLGFAIGTATREGIARMANHGMVARIAEAPEISLIKPKQSKEEAAGGLSWGLQRMNVDTLWAKGHRGQGILVGHVDTGVDGTHPALKDAIAHFAEFNLAGDLVPGVPPSYSHRHGTHTAGTIAARAIKGQPRVGVAPEAKLACALVIEGGSVITRVLGGLEWVIGKRARLVSASLGLRGQTSAFEDIIDRLRENGILPIFAIGNEGPGTSRSPGNYANVLSVGACSAENLVADFSGSDAIGAGMIVPHLVAPGVDIVSCNVGGGYYSNSGTSMATPHIAGLAALLFSARPESTMDEVEAAILASCYLPGSMLKARANRGMPDAVRALDYLLKRAHVA